MMAKMGLNNTPEFSELEKFFEGFKKQITQVIQIQAEAKVHAAAVVHKISTEGLPPPAGGAAPVTSIPETPAGAAAPGLVPGGESPTLGAPPPAPADIGKAA